MSSLKHIKCNLNSGRTYFITYSLSDCNNKINLNIDGLFLNNILVGAFLYISLCLHSYIQTKYDFCLADGYHYKRSEGL